MRILHLWGLCLFAAGSSIGCSTGEFDRAPASDSPLTLDEGNSEKGGSENTGSAGSTASLEPLDSGTSGSTHASDGSTGRGEASLGTTLGESSRDPGNVCGNGVVEAEGGCDGDEIQPLAPIEVCQSVSVPIPDLGGGAATITVNVETAGVAEQVRARVEVDHTYVGDLAIDLHHEGTRVRLLDRECPGEANLRCLFDDSGAELDCGFLTDDSATVPAESLKSFHRVSSAGAWDFVFEDFAAADLGTAREVCVLISF